MWDRPGLSKGSGSALMGSRFGRITGVFSSTPPPEAFEEGVYAPRISAKQGHRNEPKPSIKRGEPHTKRSASTILPPRASRG